MSLRRIAAHYVLTPNGLTPWGIVTFDEAGTVVDVDSDARVDSRAGVEFFSGILIPGMVNAHTHLELSYLRGLVASGGGFVGFAEGLNAVRRTFSAEEMEQAAAFWDARMRAEGVVAVGDVANGDVTFGVKRRSAICYHTFIELFGLAAHSGSLAPLLERAHADGLAATATPHSTYLLNEDAFRGALGERVSIHFMESREEEELFRGGGALREWNAGRGLSDDFAHKYASPAERVMALVQADRPTLLIHNTFVTRGDVEKLADHFGRNVTFVLCPRSNRYINDADPPARMLLEAGVRVAVGTDSLASNTSLSMIDELKSLCGIPLVDRLRWATAGGAQALGMDGWSGSFETGKRPGAVIIEGVDLGTMELLPDASARRL